MYDHVRPRTQPVILRFQNDQANESDLGRIGVAESAIVYGVVVSPDPTFLLALVECLPSTIPLFAQMFEVLVCRPMTYFVARNGIWVVKDACGPVQRLEFSNLDLKDLTLMCDQVFTG